MPTAWPAKTWLKLIFFISQTNAAAACDHDGFVVEGIIDIGQTGVRAGRRLIDFRA